MEIDAVFMCCACGSENGILVDPTGGEVQDYIEDCQVCCRPHRLRITLTAGGEDAVVVAELC